MSNVSLGFRAFNLAVNPMTNMVYADGCDQIGIDCDAVVSIVNETSRSLVATVHLNSAYSTTMTSNPATNIVYASGARELVALNGTNGGTIFHVDPDTCGPFLGMTVVPSANQVAMVPQNYDYLLVYDGTSGALLTMYSLPSSPQLVAYNPSTNEFYVATSGHLLAFPDLNFEGDANPSLIGSNDTCLPV